MRLRPIYIYIYIYYESPRASHGTQGPFTTHGRPTGNPSAPYVHRASDPPAVHGLYEVCLCSSHVLTMGCRPWAACGLSMGCTWIVRGLPVDCPWAARGLSMSCPWAVHGLCVGRPRAVREVSMGCPWAARGLLMGYPCKARGLYFPWDTHGHSMKK